MFIFFPSFVGEKMNIPFERTIEMFKPLPAALIALAFTVAACTPDEARNSAQALCTSAQIVLPFVQDMKSGAVTKANAAVAKYCGEGMTNLPNAAAALAAALQGVMPLVKQTPAALTALHRTPIWSNPAFQRGWSKL